MHLNKIILLFLSLFISTFISAQTESTTSGATAVIGAPSAEKGTDKISLDHAIIRFNGFSEKMINNYDVVPLSSYSTLYEFNNTSDGFVNVQVTVPVTVFFTEFDKGKRSNILENLAQIMPELIDLKGDAATIKTKLQQKFTNRLFIRKFFNPSDLVKLHMDVRAFQDEKEMKVNRIMLEFKMIKDERKKTDILVMETHFEIPVQFRPRQSSAVKIEMVTPAFKIGSKQKYYYSPFMTGNARSWSGNIKSLYLITDIAESSVAFPYYMKYDLMNYQYNQNLIVIKDHEPEKYEKIGFYSEREAYCDCGSSKSFADKVALPKSLKSFTASSYFSGDYTDQNACFTAATDAVVVKFVPDIDNSDSYDLSFIKDAVKIERSESSDLDDLVENKCDNGKARIEFDEPYHPVWAFDIGLDSLGIFGYREKGHFNLQTAWCEGVSGTGVGEYLEFQITQPVDYIKFHTGIQRDEKTYNENNRVRIFQLQHVIGNERRTLLFSDEWISSSYEVNLEPGVYRLVIKDVYRGTAGHVTCFSGIYFSFTTDDVWLTENYKKL